MTRHQLCFLVTKRKSRQRNQKETVILGKEYQKTVGAGRWVLLWIDSKMTQLYVESKSMSKRGQRETFCSITWKVEKESKCEVWVSMGDLQCEAVRAKNYGPKVNVREETLGNGRRDWFKCGEFYLRAGIFKEKESGRAMEKRGSGKNEKREEWGKGQSENKHVINRLIHWMFILAAVGLVLIAAIRG